MYLFAGYIAWAAVCLTFDFFAYILSMFEKCVMLKWLHAVILSCNQIILIYGMCYNNIADILVVFITNMYYWPETVGILNLGKISNLTDASMLGSYSNIEDTTIIHCISMWRSNNLELSEGVYPQRDGSLAIVNIDASKGFIDLWVHFFVAIEDIHRKLYRRKWCFFGFD